MNPKRGQPPKPPEDLRTRKKLLSYSDSELAVIKTAYEVAGSPNTLSRWLATVTLEEARRIIESAEK